MFDSVPDFALFILYFWFVIFPIVIIFITGYIEKIMKFDTEDPPQVPEEDENLPSGNVGANGVVVVSLSPSGRIQIDGKKYPALSRFGYLGRDTVAEVIAVGVGQYVVLEKSSE